MPLLDAARPAEEPDEGHRMMARLPEHWLAGLPNR